MVNIQAHIIGSFSLGDEKLYSVFEACINDAILELHDRMSCSCEEMNITSFI
jgi:hypothetical protein